MENLELWYHCWDLIGLTSMIWTSKNAADNKIASLSYKSYACFRRNINDLLYIIIRYKEVYLWLLSMIHVPLVCKLTGTACMRLPSTFTHTHKPKLFRQGCQYPRQPCPKIRIATSRFEISNNTKRKCFSFVLSKYKT